MVEDRPDETEDPKGFGGDIRPLDSSGHQRDRIDPSQSPETNLHLLKIELRRIRQEASAARLDARAAELELQIERLTKQLAGQSITSPTVREGLVINPSRSSSRSQPSSIEHSPHGFTSWDEVREVLMRGPSVSPRDQPRLRFDGPERPRYHLGQTAMLENPAVDSVDSPITPPHRDSMPITPRAKVAGAETDELVTTDFESHEPESTELDSAELESPGWTSTAAAITSEASIAAQELAVDDNSELADRSTRKSRPMAMIISAVVHAIVILLLAGWTLSSQRPKDQVAITASPTVANEVSMETFSLETSEPELEPTEPTESETEYELSPIGEVAVAEFSPDASPAPPSPAVSMLSSGASAASAAAMSLSSASDAKIQFCGVEGGGNHFVYLVDSSGSMGAGFDSARRELLQSIDLLKPNQRFYVVFFDEKPDYMRLSDPSVDEPRSVEATAENKLALRRWALQVQQDRGKNPYEVLEFALKLKPDVIFLLSDGEFPQRVEDLLAEKNRINNLFGDGGPMCIVHTIAYYSEEGESRMRRIAQNNGGQYRYVPKP